MAAAFGLVMDISALWLRVSFAGADLDKTGTVQKTHDRIMGTVWSSNEEDAESLFAIGFHIPKSVEFPHGKYRGKEHVYPLSQIVASETVKKFFIRTVSANGRVEAWFGDKDVAADAVYVSSRVAELKAAPQPQWGRR